ncbi:hypothetical protein Q8A67_004187 [Cirrhinus molitorella]|uniref:Uncharacterized protein n=1 Tax=Cirrhinus molitorella TaxID=172907 RepID=A0AA88Q9D3_9TELE|nr:hypothetical protein Q8A67_004187 [Cirrhinus molitorella]
MISPLGTSSRGNFKISHPCERALLIGQVIKGRCSCCSLGISLTPDLLESKSMKVTRANKRSRTVLKHSSSRKKRREPRAPSEDAERLRAHSHRSSSHGAASSFTGSYRRLAEGAGGRLRRLPPPLGGLKAPRWKFGHFSQPVRDLGVICHKYMPFKCS